MTWIILILIAWFAWAFAADRILDNPRGDVLTGLVYRTMRIYARFVHRLVVHGVENVPESKSPGPLIVVCNHTAGVDPLLVQSVCPFEVKWMMASDMRLPAYEAFWVWAGIISTNRMSRDGTGLREAMAHLRKGGVLGVFPEGGIERPPRQILPFFPGVGLIVSRSGASVLPVIIDGTPVVAHAWDSLSAFSNSVLTFGPRMEFAGTGESAAEIAETLRAWYLLKTGWPENPGPPTFMR